MKIAVIGGGISGLSAAYFLSKKHEVHLFESEPHLGGHAHTTTVSFGKKRIPVDTGFMVFNPPQYPHLTALFKHLSVKTIPTTMLFSVSMDGGAFEFSSNVPRGVFADRTNIISMSFYAFLLEIHRFNVVARRELKKGIPEKMTLKGFLKKHHFSKDLEQKYLLPTVGSIWSTPRKLAREFPVSALLKFLDNHELLQETSQPKWKTIFGGSIEYVHRIKRNLLKNGAVIHTGESARVARRFNDGVVIASRGKRHEFDYVVMAVHGDDVLKLVKHPTRKEREVFKRFRYEKNEVIVHSDPALMPRRKEAWAAWNYIGITNRESGISKVSLTYWMNILQSIDKRYPLFVTLNPSKKPRKSSVHARFRYSHPLYSVDTLKSQKMLISLQGKNRTLYCGAYFGYGFHEDGIASAVSVARYFGISPPWKKSKHT